MSGIAGIIHFDGRPVEPGQIEAMTGAMHHRGPDGINHWRKNNVALGQCMLRTTPESLEETQPLSNEDGSLTLVMDGRVDNWEELRRSLLSKGAVLRSRADAELVLRAYEVWGHECLSHLDGDFALVIWDARRQEAFCARDRMGNKPFTYHWNGKTLAFASELHPVLALPWVPELLNEDVVAEYLGTEWSSLDETLWQDVLRLKPAHFMVASSRGTLQISRYWTPDLQRTLPCRSDAEYVEHYRALFADVVRRTSRSLAPVACEVSGGLDSSAIFAMAEALRGDGQLLAPGLEGYTLDFSGDAGADEMEYARAVGTHLGRHIHEVTPAHMPLGWYEDQARESREFPDFPNGAMGLSIAEVARLGGSRVLLSGTGGDEWLSGSRRYYGEAMARLNGRELLLMLQRDSREVGATTALWWAIRHGILPQLPKQLRSTVRKAEASASSIWGHRSKFWLTVPMQQRLALRKKGTSDLPTAWPRLGQHDQWLALCDPYVTVAREINERRVSRVGLEWRQPFWNSAIVEAAFATPEHLRLRGREDKWLHRRAMAEILPESVVQRQSKAEFSVTFNRYWNELEQYLVTEVLPRNLEWIDSSGLGKVFSAEYNRKNPHANSWIAWALFGLDAVVHPRCIGRGEAPYPLRQSES